MKLKLTNSCVLAAALLLIGVSSARAEVDQVEKAKVPFDFYAENQKMPAGTYDIGLDPDGDITTLTDSSGHRVLLMAVPAGDSGGDRPKLVFDHSEGSYFLREVKNNFLNVDIPTTHE